MIFQLISLTILFLVSINASVKKCCPIGKIVKNKDYQESNFGCITDVVIRNYSETQNMRNQSTSLPRMIGYNVLIDENFHWPVCNHGSQITSIIFSDSRKISQSMSCVDVMNDRYYIFTCKESLKNISDLVEVYNLKKCCDENLSFDILSRQCVDNNKSSLNLDFHEILANKKVIFDTGIPDCKEDEVLVEYHSLVHKLEIYESSLLIVTENIFLEPGIINHESFCIEATANSLTTPPDGNNSTLFQLKQSSKYTAKACRPMTVCNQIPCVRKCCKEGQRMGNNGKMYCENHDTHLDLMFYHFNYSASHEEPSPMEPTEYGIMMPLYCERYHLRQEDDDIHFHSGIDGSVFVPATEEFHANDEYCVDYFVEKHFDPLVDKLKVETFVCLPNFGQKVVEINLGQHIHATVLAISATFLGITFIVYVSLPELLNLHGKTLVCHVISLFVAFTTLSILKFSTDERLTHCELYAYIMFFSFSAAFSWLNVMCFDIFWTIGSMRPLRENGRKKEKRIIFYSLFAWGWPSLITLIVYLVDNTDWIEKEFRPNFGINSCWFDHSSVGHFIFFLLPVGLEISANVVFFVITAFRCNRIKASIHRMQMNDVGKEKKQLYIADKAIFLMNLKLFLVMGVSWLMEVISPFINADTLWWILLDSCNLLQGVFIFFIFVFKRKVLEALKAKLGVTSIADAFSLTELIELTRRRSSQTASSTLTTAIRRPSDGNKESLPGLWYDDDEFKQDLISVLSTYLSRV